MATLTEVAIHESGHAVFARILGRDVEHVQIEAYGRPLEYRGGVYAPGGAVAQRWRAALAHRTVPRTRKATDPNEAEVPCAFLWQEVCREMAGACAVQLMEITHDEAGLYQNHSRIEAHLALLQARLGRTEKRLRQYAAAATRAALLPNLTAIDSLSNALIERMEEALALDAEVCLIEITAPEANEIIDSAGVTAAPWQRWVSRLPR